MDCVIDRRVQTQFVFENLDSFRTLCRQYSSDSEALTGNHDFSRLAGIFSSFPRGSHIIIETDDFQYIPFEALRCNDLFLSAGWCVSRRTPGDPFNSGSIRLEKICILKCFADKRHNAFEHTLTSIFRQYPIVYDIKTVFSLDGMIAVLALDEYSIIHIIAHIENDTITDNTSNEIRLNELRSKLTNTHCSLIVLSACGKLDFFDSREDNLFTPFVCQISVKAVVGMNRVIYANKDLTYLRAFYKSLFAGKTVSDAVRCAINANLSAVSAGEDNPLPMIHFGHPHCRLAKAAISREKRKQWVVIAALLAVLIIGLGVFFITRPRIEYVRLEGFSLSGRAIWLGQPKKGRKYVATGAAMSSGKLVICPQSQRCIELSSDGSFTLPLFESSEEMLNATEGYVLILEITPEEEQLLQEADDLEFIRYVNKNNKIAFSRPIRHGG
jgi:hypothetical protein